ncbi:MAG: 2OG-Fe(II) oxygenase [Candidatus Omnitrophica bacterium]|nr:2OG-Fe(II) oxygenase [Candidatus Omnitrophota bacterium]
MNEQKIEQIHWNEKNLDQIANNIAEGLSDRAYVIIDQFLKPLEVNIIRSHMDQLKEEGDFKKAGIGASHKFQVNEEIRKDWIHWVNPEDTIASTQIFTNQLKIIMNKLNQLCFLGLKDFEMHYAIYPKGAYYKRHLDQFQFSDHRRLTFLCYLNDAWKNEDGGHLRIYLPRGENHPEYPFDISPIAGRLVMFRSDLLEHEVLECHRQRYSLTGWMLDQLNELTFL